MVDECEQVWEWKEMERLGTEREQSTCHWQTDRMTRAFIVASLPSTQTHHHHHQQQQQQQLQCLNEMWNLLSSRAFVSLVRPHLMYSIECAVKRPSSPWLSDLWQSSETYFVLIGRSRGQLGRLTALHWVEMIEMSAVWRPQCTAITSCLSVYMAAAAAAAAAWWLIDLSCALYILTLVTATTTASS